MRFAWLRSTDGLEPGEPPGPIDRVVFVFYNAVWWLPVILVIAGLISYTTGLLSFLAISIVRAVVNLYRNNVLPVERAISFPLRSP